MMCSVHIPSAVIIKFHSMFVVVQQFMIHCRVHLVHGACHLDLSTSFVKQVEYWLLKTISTTH